MKCDSSVDIYLVVLVLVKVFYTTYIMMKTYKQNNI